jgi:hypothetical protein
MDEQRMTQRGIETRTRGIKPSAGITGETAAAGGRRWCPPFLKGLKLVSGEAGMLFRQKDTGLTTRRDESRWHPRVTCLTAGKDRHYGTVAEW